MSQPRRDLYFRGFTEPFSMRKFYTTERSQKPQRSQSKKQAKQKNMSEASPVDHMVIDPSPTNRDVSQNGQPAATFLRDGTDDQYVVIDCANVKNNLSRPTEVSEPASELNALKLSRVESQRVKEEMTNKYPGDGEESSLGNGLGTVEPEKIQMPGSKAEETENPDLAKQMLQLTGQLSDLRSKVTSLESSRRPTNVINSENGQVSPSLSTSERQKYDNKIRDMQKSREEMEQQIHTLLNAQEHSMKYQNGIESRYRAALDHIEKEKHAREESELNLRSQITSIQGIAQKEKERAQRYMKTMAEMQSADTYKLDNATIVSSVKQLRYHIKNWAWAQRFIPSLPAQGLISTYANRALGGRERGPNYEFLKEIHPHYQEYTDSSHDFKWLLQAYVWKRIVELVFVDDLWAGRRRSLHDEEIDQKLQVGYRAMKIRLEPEDNSPQTYVAQYHEWRSNTCRLISQHITPELRKHTIDFIRDDIVRPLYYATEPIEQEIRNIEDLEVIIDTAMRLGASMAEQRARFAFELVPVAAYGKLEFLPGNMTDPYTGENERWDPRTHFRAVWLNTAPRLLKWGTSEGTGFEGCVQLLEGEVETRTVPRNFAGRRKGNN